jgi:hypothetical protein
MDSSERLEFNFERRNIKNVWRSGKLTEAQWEQLAKRFSKEIKKYNISNPKAFSWKTNKSFGNKATALIGQTHNNLTTGIEGFMQQGWGLANKKNNALAAQYLKNFHLSTKQFPSYFNANVGAMNTFINRSINGLNLSQNIWKMTNEAKDILESFVGAGLAVGRPSKAIAKDVLECLKNPSAFDLHPPRGTYRSPYKNALRMARTETNMAYRAADSLRYQQLDFVTGIEIKLSGSHPKYDICDEMVGPYPKGFQFLGWHPNCYCYQVSILSSRKDFIASVKENKPITKAKYIRGMPKQAQAYVKKNMKTFLRYKQKPYWIENNKRYIANALGGPVPPQLDYISVQADKLMARAQVVGDDVYALSKEYADKFGGTTTDINFKGKDSIMRKAVDELGGDIRKIKDSVRTTIIVEADQIESVVAAMSQDARFTRGAGKIRHQTPDKYMGYNGILTNIETRTGLIAEIQVLSPEMIFAKMPPDEAVRLIGGKRWKMIEKATGKPGGLGHKFYEEYRVLDKSIAGHKAKMDQIKKLSEEYYAHFQKTINTVEKVVPDTLGYTPAKTIKEAELWAKEAGIEIYVEGSIAPAELLETYNAIKESAYLYEQRLGVKFGTNINFGQSWDTQFMKKVKIVNKPGLDAPFAEYLRTGSAYADPDSMFINLAKRKEIDFAENIKDIAKRGPEWFPSQNVTSLKDVIVHEAGHNYYFAYDSRIRRAFSKKWLDEELYYKATSLFGQESASEFFAEAMVSYMRGEKLEAVKIIEEYFELGKRKSVLAGTLQEVGGMRKTQEELEAIVRKAEKEIQENAFETAIMYDEYGNEVFRKAGEATQVRFTEDEARMAFDKIFTHNHPSGLKYPRNSFGAIGNAFSEADLMFAATHNVREIRACTVRAKFIARRPPGGWPEAKTIWEEFQVAKEYYMQTRFDELWNRKGSFFYQEPGNINPTLIHLSWKRACKKLGIPYIKYVF